MTYREKLEDYRKKLLSEKEMEEVKEEIEKVDAINDYLADCLEEELDLRKGGAGSSVGETKLFENREDILENKAEDFEKYVKKSIRRVYMKMSLGICAVILAVLLFVQFGLSPLIESLYYDPTEQMEVVSENGQSAIIYNKMAMDYRIYAELTMPCKNEVDILAFPQGYGNYTLNITSLVSYGIENAKSIGGQIRKGRLELYEPDYLDKVPANFFACYGMNPDSKRDYEEQMRVKEKHISVDEDGREYRTQIWHYDSLESAREAVESLEPDRKYLAYVSLRRDLNFQETNELMKEVTSNTEEFIAQRWLAIRNDEGNTFPLDVFGYNYDTVSLLSVPAEYNEKYPYLAFYDSEKEYDYYEMREKEYIMKQHVVSMCKYLEDREEFVNMMEYGRTSYTGKFKESARYIEEHGLNCYGFVCITTKADMLKMLENDEIIGIIPKDWV